MSRNNTVRIAVCLLLAALCLPLLGSALVDPATLNIKTSEYKTAEVTRGSFTKDATTGGSVYYPVKYDVRCESRNARIRSINLKRSSELEAGQVLGTVYCETSRAGMAEQQLNLIRSQESLEEGIREREEAIADARKALSSITDATEMEIACLNIEKMEIELESFRLGTEYSIAGTERAIAELEGQLADVDLVAPVTGGIDSYKYLNEGDSLRYNEVLLTEYDGSIVLIRCESSVTGWRYGEEVQIKYGPRNNARYTTGHIVKADNILPNARRTGYFYVLPDEPIPADDLIQVTVTGLQYDMDDVLTVSKHAVTLYRGKDLVSILNGSSIAKRFVNVSLSNNEVYLVLQGLAEGQSLILD